MAKPTKQGGFWSYTGISILCYIPILILMVIIYALCIMPFVDMNTTLDKVINAIVAFVVAIATTFLSVHFFAKIRIVTKETAKRICLIGLSISGFLILLDIVGVFIWQEAYYIDPIYILSSIVGTPVIFLVNIRLLLRKAEQQEID